jgi:uncharacterized tellurite resistance protein B-like protein
MNRKLVETLAKVIVAAGWADKALTLEERNNLKDLLLQFQQHLPDEKESAVFEMYTESPIQAAEQEHLVNELREAVWSEEDKAFVIAALKDMVEADGKITNDEQAILDGIQAKLESVDTGVFGDLGRLIRGPMQRRSESLSNSPNREKYFADFLKNKIYYAVRHRLDLGEAELEISDADLRKLSAVGGLMARVAQIDGVVIEKEIDKITSILQKNWGLSREAATFVTEVAISEVSSNFDYLRMSREFVEMTTPAERAGVLDVLFTVALVDGQVSDEERREVHNIADYLLLSDNVVAEAHSKITG